MCINKSELYKLASHESVRSSHMAQEHSTNDEMVPLAYTVFTVQFPVRFHQVFKERTCILQRSFELC